MPNTKKSPARQHPTLHQVDVTCSCGHTMLIRSIIKAPFQVETCSQCHNAYTGENRQAQKGRAEKFLNKYNHFNLSAKTKAKPAAAGEKPAGD